MNKKAFESHIHNIFAVAYEAVSDKENYTAEEGFKILDVFVKQIPIEFSIPPAKMIAADKAIQRSLASIKRRPPNNIELLMIHATLVILEETKTINRSFKWYLLLSSIFGGLQFAPKNNARTF